MASPAANNPFEGYTWVPWPDLAADRLATRDLSTTRVRLKVDTHSSLPLYPLALGAAARILATYCGVSDVLVAVRLVQNPQPVYVRIQWDDQTNWSTISRDIQDKLKGLENALEFSQIRSFLKLEDGQTPALFDWTDLQGQPPPNEHISFAFDLDTLELTLYAPKNLVHDSVSRQIIDQIEWVIQQALLEPTSSVATLPPFPPHLASAYDRVAPDELARIYNHAPVTCLATDYLAVLAKNSPEATAVSWFSDLSPDYEAQTPSEAITYNDLDRRSNQLARWLKGQGLEKEDRVAVSMSRDVSFHVAMMGIMKSGGCYVPIDPELPEERKTYIAQDSKARFVLTTRNLSPSYLFGQSTVYLDDHGILAIIESQEDLAPNFATPEDLAYMLYTSGTTGNPKGCLLTQQGLAEAILSLSYWASKAKMAEPSRGRYLSIASIAFDVHIAEVFVPLALGIPILSAPRSQLLENLPFYVRALEISHLGLVPSLIEATMNAVQEDGGNTVLRYIASGGEKISDVILDKWAGRSQTVLANFYGPSEATIGCCATIMSPSSPRANIGRPFANVSAYVVDSNMNILPRGGVGELVIEGPLVGRGYHGRPDLTDKVFKAWPGRENWAYRTGDSVRMMPDSTIEILGRIDTQIKLRGVRIESEGVSAIVRKGVLPGSPITLDAVTVLAKHPSIGIQQLISFFAWDSSISVLVRKSQKPHLTTPPPGCVKRIQEVCEAELASYMRPSHLIPLSWLPLSSNGKVDEKMLLSLFASLDIQHLTSLTGGSGDETKKPLTAMEMVVCDALRPLVLIGIDNIHSGTGVFECGLDSFAAVKLASTLSQRCRRRLHAAEIMKAQTIEGIAALLRVEPSSTSLESERLQDIFTQSSDPVRQSYPQESIEAVFPPFAVQEGVLSRSASDDTLYVQHVLLRCETGVSLSKLEAAWRKVMRRQTILRTVFHFGKVLSQVVLKPDSCSLPWSQKRTTQDSQDDFVRWFHVAEATAISKHLNTHIDSQPPFNVTAYETTGDRLLCLSIHHAIYDGISLPLLLEAVEREYFGLSPRSAATAPDILRYITSLDRTKTRSFWMDRLASYDWPLLGTMPADPAGRSNSYTIHFQTKLSNLKSLATPHRVTLQAIFTAAFATLLSTSLYGRSDVTFGVIRSGRLLPLEGINESLCPLITVIPVRVDVQAPDLLQRVQECISESVEHEHISLGKVQSWVRPGRPLFDTLFSVSVKEDRVSDLWSVVESKPPKPDYLLSIELVISPGQDAVLLQAAWLGDVLDSNILKSFLEKFEVTVLDIVSGRAPISLDKTQSDMVLETVSPQSLSNEKDSIALSNVDTTLFESVRLAIAEFLGVSSNLIGDSTSFISLGLDSIKSVGLARELRKHGHEVSPIELMKYSSLASLSARLASADSPPLSDGTQSPSYNAVLQGIRKSTRPGPLLVEEHDTVAIYPTTSLQAGMLSQTIASEGKLYVHAFPLELSLTVNPERLRASWSEVVDKLSILRTSFHFDSEMGIWIQAVHSINTLDWSETTYVSAEEFALQSEQFIQGVKLRDEVDLRVPPLRIRLFRSVAPDLVPHRLVVVLHHALYDGISIGKLFDLVAGSYRGAPLETPVQFFDLLPQITSQEQEGTSFWLRRLQECPFAALPEIQVLGLRATSTASKEICLPPLELRALLGQAKATVQCLAQAAWAKLISSITGCDDVLFGHVVSGRSLPNTEDVIGPVLTTIPCRVRIRQPNVIDLLRHIQQDNVEGLAWQHVSLRRMQRQLKREALWDNIFSFQPLGNSTERHGLWKFCLDSEESEGVHTQYLLSVEFHQTENGFLVRCAARPEFSLGSSLEELLLHLETILKSILSQGDEPHFEDIKCSPGGGSGMDPTTVGDYESTQVAGTSVGRSDEIYHKLRHLISVTSKVPLEAIVSTTPLIALGIDSISAIQISNKANKAGIRIPTVQIINCRTFADLVAKAQTQPPQLAPSAPSQVLCRLPPNEIVSIRSRFDRDAPLEQVLPMSPGQKFFVSAWQSTEGRKYRHVFMFLLPADIDKSRLKVAWLFLLHRHPLLRATFASAPNSVDPRIVIFKTEIVPTTWSEDTVADSEFYQAAAAKVRDLAANPPQLRLPQARAVFHASTSRAALLLQLHHFQYDAWSLALLARDLSSIYQTQYATPSSDLSTYLAYLNSKADQLAIQDMYWKKAVPTPFQPEMFPRLNVFSAPRPLRTIRVVKSAIEGVSACEKRAAQRQVSLNAILVACWARLQSQYSGVDDICFGMWQNGRTGAIANVDHFAVPCVNILPMFVKNARETIQSVASRVQETLYQQTSIIEQTDFSRCNALSGINGPLTNVFLNVFRSSGLGQKGDLLEPVNLPYDFLENVACDPKPTIDRVQATSFIQDDLSIDVIVIPERDAICVAVDAAGKILSDQQADILVQGYSTMVKEALGIN